jgi:hypothetical protein
VDTIDGDKVDGRTVYVGFSGSGYAYYDVEGASSVKP